jgi:hypothetical protein
MTVILLPLGSKLPHSEKPQSIGETVTSWTVTSLFTIAHI